MSLPASWDPYQYLLLMGGCLLITLPLELVLRARVYSRSRRLLAALLPVVVLFSAWDVVGIVRDHWSYSPRFTMGWRVPFTPMPVEELVFFVVIPICGLLTYGAVGFCLKLFAAWRSSGNLRSALARADADVRACGQHRVADEGAAAPRDARPSRKV